MFGRGGKGQGRGSGGGEREREVMALKYVTCVLGQLVEPYVEIRKSTGRQEVITEKDDIKHTSGYNKQRYL